MGRSVDTALQDLLDLEDCNTQTTVDLQFVQDEFDTNIATADFTVDASPDRTYVSDLRQLDDLKQSIFAPPDRVNGSVQNVDKNFGALVQDEIFPKSVAIVGRYYTDPHGVLPAVWVELFRGEARPTGMDEMEVKIEILHDLAAAGYCVADWSLAENCQFKFKQEDTCGYSGGETTCNKRRNSPGGCFGRDNEFHFGGMEFPDPQAPAPPTGGGGDDEEIPPHPSCPRVDQYVLAKAADSDVPEAKMAMSLTEQDMLWHPVKGTFHRVKELRTIRDQKIWRVFAENGSECYSSASHRVIKDRDDTLGSRIDTFKEVYPLLTCDAKNLTNCRVASVHDTGEIDDVIMIEMEDGHIYCAGDDGVTFIVCHNKRFDP